MHILAHLCLLILIKLLYKNPRGGRVCVCVLVEVILWYSWDSDNIFMCDKVFNSVFIASLGINECLYYDHLVTTMMILFAQGSIVLFNSMKKYLMQYSIYILKYSLWSFPCYWSIRGICCMVSMHGHVAHNNA
jgi:hypothetical protein